MKDGKKVTAKQGKATLVDGVATLALSKAASEHAGVYTCQVENAGGSVSTDIAVAVHG